MRHFHIVVGSVMGTALDIAKSLAEEIHGYGHTAQLNSPFDQQDFEHALEDKQNLVILVCTSNTGMGDLPENIQPFYHYITATPPPIAGVPFGLINLGDSTYPNFAQAGTTVDNALQDIAASRIGDPLVMDATEGNDPEHVASEWLKAWITHFDEQNG